MLCVRECLRCGHGLAPDLPANQEKRCAEREETHVPPQLVGSGAYMVQPQDLVIENAFNDVEVTPACQNPGPKDA